MAKSRYEIVPRVLTPEINPGDAAGVEIYVTGTGAIQKSKLVIIFPSAITSSDNPGELMFSVATKTDNATGKHSAIVGKDFQQVTKCDRYGIHLGLSLAYFLDAPNKAVNDWTLPMKVGETTPANQAPIKLTLNTQEDAPAGDYDIQFVLTYLVDDEIETSKEAVSIHVNSWTERHKTTIVVVGIILAAVAIVVGLITTR